MFTISLHMFSCVTMRLLFHRTALAAHPLHVTYMQGLEFYKYTYIYICTTSTEFRSWNRSDKWQHLLTTENQRVYTWTYPVTGLNNYDSADVTFYRIEHVNGVRALQNIDVAYTSNDNVIAAHCTIIIHEYVYDISRNMEGIFVSTRMWIDVWTSYPAGVY
jgi:hypothetical protein